MGEARTPADSAALREEHDLLAKRLEARASVDLALRGILWAAGGALAVGIAAALAWNRWGYAPPGQPPGGSVPWLSASGALAFAALAALLLATGALKLRHSRRLAREEATLFARLRELRRALEIDP
ncbi:MAG TPA: hypothetical protein VMU15_18860 [Anaeromyxobacter sp.]|nr:hypothetical protein [Anaeromyxobacter sp.]